MAEHQRFARGSIGPGQRDEDWLTIAVRARFPKLVAALGDGLFMTLLAGFKAREPSARQSLEIVHERLPDYLATCAVYPLWYGELAALDRAHTRVLCARPVRTLTRSQLTSDCTLQLVPGHGLVQLTTNSDELWRALDAAALSCKRARVSKPYALDWPRTILMWRGTIGEIQTRTIDPDEATALRAATRGTSLVELSAGLPHSRALDLVVRWIDDGVLGVPG